MSSAVESNVWTPETDVLLRETTFAALPLDWITCALITNHITALISLNFRFASVSHCLQRPEKSSAVR